MAQVQVIFTPVRVQHQGAHVDSAAVLERLSALVGNELAAGWVLADFVRVDGSAVSWLATLEHDSENICATVKERIGWIADPEFRLWQDESIAPQEAEMAAEFAPPAPPPLLLPLPAEIPGILSGSEANRQWSAAGIGVLAGIAAAVALGLLLPPGSLIQKVFDPHTPFAAVPAAILCFFFWGLAQGVNRLRRLAAIRPSEQPGAAARGSRWTARTWPRGAR